MHLPMGFAWRLLRRNWRGGEVRILAGSLALAVAVVTAIAVFTDRMEQSLVRQSNSYLAADRVIESRYDIPDAWRQLPTAQKLQQSEVAEFSSMVFAGQAGDESMQLVSVKAVASGYPLRGTLEVSQVPFALGEDVRKAQGGPGPGEVWVDSRLMPLMNLKLGDALTLGNRDFKITQVVIREPDSSTGFRVLGPRVMMHWQDLASTGVVLPGSRVVYRWLLAGDEEALRAFVDEITPRLGEHYRLLTLQDAQKNIGRALDRGGRFLMLAGVIGVLLAGVAISIASQQFAQRHIDQVALMKSLGASASRVRSVYVLQMLMLGGLASLLGLMVGEGLQQLITASIASLFQIELLPARVSVYALGLLTGLLCLLCFALPPLWHLPSVPPMRVIRRELDVSVVGRWLKGLLGALALVILVAGYSGDLRLTLSMVIGLAVVIVASALLAALLLKMGGQLGSRAGSIWRLAMANLRRYRSQSITQIMVFACALMLLMVLFVVRTTLIDDWRLQLPEDAPNHFLLNIAPYQKAEVERLIADQGLQGAPMYPMVLGRLTGKNQQLYTQDDRDRVNTLRRELNLSWARELAADNQIVKGQWWDQWPANDRPGVSVEQEAAEKLGMAVGDELTFSIGGLSLKAEVASIRSVNWDSMTPNFYFLFSPGALDPYAPNYLTSVYIPPQKKAFVNQLLQTYPTVVVLEVDRIIERIRNIIHQVGRAIELVLWLVWLGGVLVLMAAVQASMANRMQEAGLLRALGSGRGLILGSLWLEFALLGGLSGVMAVFGAEGLLIGLQTLVFDQPLTPHYVLWWSGPLGGAVFIGLLGLMACRSIVRVPPNVVLREAEY